MDVVLKTATCNLHTQFQPFGKTPKHLQKMGEGIRSSIMSSSPFNGIYFQQQSHTGTDSQIHTALKMDGWG